MQMTLAIAPSTAFRCALIAAVTTMVVAALGVPIAGAAPAPSPDPVITEVMQNPGHTYDSRGEWFEVHNPGSEALDLTGWTMRDDDADSHIITGKLIIPADGYVVIARNGDPAINGGVEADYVYGDSVFLFNGSDELELVHPDGAVADRVAWDDGATFPDPDGATMSLASIGLDNGNGINWCTAVTIFGAGDLGTPGAANVCEGADAEIVINEVMQNPDVVSDRNGEWLELHNVGPQDVSLAGWTVRDDGFNFHRIAEAGAPVVPAGGFVVLGRNGDPLVNGGIAVDYVIDAGLVLHNTEDEIVLADAEDRLVDVVEYDDGVTFPDPRGASMSLRSPELDNADGANWCTSPVTTGPVDLATPGMPNDCEVPAPPPELIISEVMNNPVAVNDTRGEWFEVYNPTGAAVDLEGWIIHDEDDDRHIIGESVVIAPGGYGVFARNGDIARNGGVVADYVYGNDMYLFNNFDELILANPARDESDHIVWDDGRSFPDAEGASMALGDLSADNGWGGNWCVSTAAFGAGDLGTPGTANDCDASANTDTVVITEIHQNPFAVGDRHGEWFEVSNPTAVDIDLNGWVVRDDDSDRHQIRRAGGLIVPAGGSIVIGRTRNETKNGGAGVDYSMGDSMPLFNGSDEIEIVDTNGRVVDRVAWNHFSSEWYVRNGASMALRDIDADNALGSSWCVSGTQFGKGDLGTPGTPNSCEGPSAGQLVISEVMQNPAAVPDSAGEWFEVHNPGDTALDIDGWVVRDNDYASHTIDNGGPLIVPANGYLVLGRNANSGQNGGVDMAYEFGADVTLTNATDELEILDAALRPIDRIAWDDGRTFPDPVGASMSLRDPAADNAAAANWCVSVTPFGRGDLGTPGAANLCEIPPPGDPVDLAVELQAKHAPVEVGDSLTYEVIVRNESKDNDTVGTWDIVLTLPEGVTLDTDRSHQRWDCAREDFPTVRCTYVGPKDVRAGKESNKISIEVTVEQDAAEILLATAAIDLAAAEFHDPNPNNDAVTIETAVELGSGPPGGYEPLPDGYNPNLSAILECVVDHGDGTLTARFGYENREDFDFVIPASSQNRIHGPVIATDGPWTEFGHPRLVPGRPGRTPFGEGVFTVAFAEGDQIVWVLHGRTATASSNSSRCSTS
jgi:hypothetical protein